MNSNTEEILYDFLKAFDEGTVVDRRDARDGSENLKQMISTFRKTILDHIGKPGGIAL